MSLGLKGRLIITGIGAGISEYDLASDKLVTLYEPPANSLVSSAAVSLSQGRAAFIYSPPPEEGKVRLGYNDLYVAPFNDLKKASPLLRGSGSEELYDNPAWSPDGKYLYFGHTIVSTASDNLSSDRRLERMMYPNGIPEIVVRDAAAPHLSSDGTRLTYLFANKDTGATDLYLANADGTNPVQLKLSDNDTYAILDKPIFSADGKYVVFTWSDPNQSGVYSDFDQLLGLRVARANNFASDLWRIPVAGGVPERLTYLRYSGIRAAFSPDGELIAVLCDAGILVMNSDGSQISRISREGGYGNLEWIP
jgi:Tol biopolymer transport system component